MHLKMFLHKYVGSVWKARLYELLSHIRTLVSWSHGGLGSDRGGYGKQSRFGHICGGKIDTPSQSLPWVVQMEMQLSRAVTIRG